MKDLELVLWSHFLFHSSFHFTLIFSSVPCCTGIPPFSAYPILQPPPTYSMPSLSSFFLLFSLLPCLRLRPAYRRMHILAGLVMHRAWPWHACLPACLTSEYPPPSLQPSLYYQHHHGPYLPTSTPNYFACKTVVLLVHNNHTSLHPCLSFCCTIILDYSCILYHQTSLGGGFIYYTQIAWLVPPAANVPQLRMDNKTFSPTAPQQDKWLHWLLFIADITSP